jgi:peptide-methionine (R)-S-oxide reductase
MDRRTLIGGGGLTLLGGAMAMFGFDRGSEAKAGSFPVTLSDAEWKRRLSPQAYAVLRKESTERAGSSPLDKEKRKGIYACAGCGHPLFSSAAKFESGTGWPSFFKPAANGVGTREDKSFFMKRVEVHCRRCGGHLGHVFNDGPRPTGLRYCMNGAALAFRPA